MIEISIVALAFAGAMWFGHRSAQHMLNGHWHRRYQHDCGFHTKWLHQRRRCSRCGVSDQQREPITVRQDFFGHWECRP